MRRFCTLAAVVLAGLAPGGRGEAPVTGAGDYCPRDVYPSVVCADDWPCDLIAVKLDDGGCWRRDDVTGRP